MTIPPNKIKVLQVNESEEHQESFFKGYEEDADIPPIELSGDQSGAQSVFSSVDSMKKSNFALTVTTIIKTVIGSGILGLPFTVSKCGYVFAILVFSGAAALNQLSTAYLLRAKNLSGHSNFSTIMHHIYQSKFSKAIGSLLIFFNNFGICIIEIIIFKSTIRKIIEDVLPDSQALGQFYTHPAFIVFIIGCCQIPSIIVKKIERLKFMALLGVTGIFVFVGAFVIHYFLSLTDYDSSVGSHPSMDLFPKDWFEAIASIPNLILALAFQMNFFPVFKGMRNANDKKMGMASLVGILICSGSYLLVGIMGYHLVHTINGSTQGIEANFLKSLPYGTVKPAIFFIINCGFLLSVFFAFPIMFFGCRNNFIALMQLLLAQKPQPTTNKWRPGQQSGQIISSYIQNQEKAQKRKNINRLFYIYTFSIYCVILGIGMGVNDIEVVFNFVGAICSTSIGILLPCFFYFTLIVKKKKEKKMFFYLSLVICAIMAPFAIFAVVAQHTRA